MKQAIMASMLLFLLVCACGDAAPADQDVPQGAAEPEQASATDSNISEACRFFTEAEAEAALGYPVKLESTSAYGSLEECRFEPVGGEQYGAGDLFIRVNQPMDPKASFAETRALGNVEDVAGLGDQAFLYATELWVLAGSHEVVVRVNWYGDQAGKVRETDIKIAKTVLSRL